MNSHDFHLNAKIIVICDLEILDHFRVNKNLPKNDNFLFDLNFLQGFGRKLSFNLLQLKSIFGYSFDLTVGDISEIHFIFQSKRFVWFILVNFSCHK